MDSRRRLVSLVNEGRSVSSVARELGVSRQTAYLWLGRASDEGLLEMSERSRRPRSSPNECEAALVKQVLEASDLYPYWGARKLHALLWPSGSAPVCERTVGRMLHRHGRSTSVQMSSCEVRRFERESSNELWQADFKRLGPRHTRVETFNVLDDATRFCLVSQVVPNQTLETLWSTLWEAFGTYGLPKQVLTDNGPAFRNNATWRWSTFDLRLMLLGIQPCHGRPYHPQTQGKVERFHGTMQRELGSAFKDNQDLSNFRDRYNWVRPHEALNLKTPGTVYQPSPRQRPERMPEPYFPRGTVFRKADETGTFSFKGRNYKLGRSFAKSSVGILEDPNGVLQIVWGSYTLAPLEDFLL